MIVEHQLKSRTAAYWAASLVLCFVATLVVANESSGEYLGFLLPLLVLAAVVAVLRFCWFFLRARGRSPAWMLLLAFNILGLLALMCLGDKSSTAGRP
jgi:membrane protease YdiL (CAAX protease family)